MGKMKNTFATAAVVGLVRANIFCEFEGSSCASKSKITGVDGSVTPLRSLNCPTSQGFILRRRYQQCGDESCPEMLCDGL